MEQYFNTIFEDVRHEKLHRQRILKEVVAMNLLEKHIDDNI